MSEPTTKEEARGPLQAGRIPLRVTGADEAPQLRQRQIRFEAFRLVGADGESIPLQPSPLQTLVADDGDGSYRIIRRWRSEEARRCKLCDRCTAQHGRDEQSICYVVIDTPIDPESAALLATLGPDL